MPFLASVDLVEFRFPRLFSRRLSDEGLAGSPPSMMNRVLEVLDESSRGCRASALLYSCSAGIRDEKEPGVFQW